jgi:hypothetical protein
MPAALSAAFPTPTERNRHLARRLKQACEEAGGAATYAGIKSKAAEFRTGKADAQVNAGQHSKGSGPGLWLAGQAGKTRLAWGSALALRIPCSALVQRLSHPLVLVYPRLFFAGFFLLWNS